jgi:hypothetical protein
MAMPVSAALTGVRPPTARRPAAWTWWSLRQPPQTCHLVRAQPDPVRDRRSRRPQPCWLRHGGRTRPQPGARTAAVFRRAVAAVGRGVRRSLRHVQLRPTGRLWVCPVSRVRAELAVTRPCGVRQRILPQPAGVRCYRKRSPARCPLVGCSHRRQARRSCRASRSRSCSRTEVMAGRSSARASSLTRAVAPGRCRARVVVVVGSRPGRPPKPGPAARVGDAWGRRRPNRNR